MATDLLPYDDRDGFIWFDGNLVPWREAKVHILTHSLHYGAAVFEGARAYDGKVFRLRDHSERLCRSARLVGYSLPYTVEELDAATVQTLEANTIKDAYVRPIAWRGSNVMGVATRGARIHVAIACWHWGSYFDPEARAKGVRVMWSPWARPAPNTAPTAAKASGLYMICSIAKNMAEDQGWQDALMLDWRGQVAEATGANLFMVKDGALHTPTTEAILNGITRQTVIALAEKRGIPVHVRAIWPQELQEADELFLTGSAAEITPVGQLGAWFYPSTRPITDVLIADYAAATRVGGLI